MEFSDTLKDIYHIFERVGKYIVIYCMLGTYLTRVTPIGAMAVSDFRDKGPPNFSDNYTVVSGTISRKQWHGCHV